MAGNKSRLDSSVNPYSSKKKTRAMRTLDGFIDIKNVSPAQIKGSNPPNFKYIDKNGAVYTFEVRYTNKYCTLYDCTRKSRPDKLVEQEEILKYWKQFNVEVECINYTHLIPVRAKWMDTIVASRLPRGITDQHGRTEYVVPNWIRTKLRMITDSNDQPLNLEEEF